MRLTSFVVWKSWGSNKVRTLLTVLGVALGIAVVTSIHVLDHNTIQSRLQQRVENYGRVDLELLPKDGTRKPAEVRRQLADLTQLVAEVGLLHGGETGAPAMVATADAQRRPTGTPQPIALYGLSPLPSRSFAHYHVALGEDLTDLDGDQAVLIGEKLAEMLKVGPGDQLLLAPSPRATIKRCVDGKLVESTNGGPEGRITAVRIKGVLSHHALGRSNGGHAVVGSFQLAQTVVPGARSYYQVNRVPGTNPDLLKLELSREFQILDQRSAMLGEGSDERAFRNGIKMVGLLALVLGMLVVFQTLSQTLLERLRQIGLMRCLGASRRAVAGIFLADGLLLALLGAVLGVGAGIALAYGLGRLEWTTLGIGKKILDFEVPTRPVLWAAGLGVLFTLAGTAFPLWKARNLPPVQVLQSRGLGDSGYLLRGVNVFLFLLLVVVLPLAYLAMTPLLVESDRETRDVLLQVGGIVIGFGGLLLAAPRLVKAGGRMILAPLRNRLPLTTFLVGKSLAHGPGRFAAAVVGLAVVLVAMLALKHITYALRAEVRQFSARAMDHHAFFAGEPRTVADLKMVRAIPGVLAAEFLTGEVQVGYLLRGIAADDLVRTGGVLAERADLAARYDQERCLIVSRRWSELHWKKSGQQTELLTGSGLKNYRILLVDDRAGFFPDERAWAVTSPRWLSQDFCESALTCSRLAVQMTPEADPVAVREAVGKLFPHSWYKRGDDIRDYLLRDVTKDFLLFDFLLALILVLVGVGLVNTMTIAAVGRAREIGVLRALGMTDRDLRRTFLVEGAVVAGLGALVAVLMGLPLGQVIVVGLNRVTGLDAPVLIPWAWVALVPLLAFATGLLAAILPGSRAIRMNPAEAVRYE